MHRKHDDDSRLSISQGLVATLTNIRTHIRTMDVLSNARTGFSSAKEGRVGNHGRQLMFLIFTSTLDNKAIRPTQQEATSKEVERLDDKWPSAFLVRYSQQTLG